MNKRRWAAVLIAAGLFVVSLVSASLTKPQENDQIEGLNSWLYGDEELASNVLEEGDSTQNRKIISRWNDCCGRVFRFICF